MNKLLKSLALVISSALIFAACSKEPVLPLYNTGKAPVLTLSPSSIAPTPADSNNVVLTLNWTDPSFATDTTNYKSVIQIDSAGKNFSSPYTKTVIGKLSGTFIAKELNNYLLGKGLSFNAVYTLEARVLSSYRNNNDLKTTNAVSFTYKTYLTPPKVPLPTNGKLYIVGDATTFGWDNPSSMPVAREFSRVSNTLYGGLFYMNGSGGYKLLQTPGVWSDQYHMLSGGTSTAGEFELRDADPTFPSPSPAGWYKHSFDFQTGRFMVESFGNNAPQELYITGDAVPSSWTNTPPSSQQFTRVNCCEYTITVALTPGKVFKFLSVSGQWQPQFGTSAVEGQLGANYGGGSDPGVFSTPATAGNYKITVNFYTNSYRIDPV